MRKQHMLDADTGAYAHKDSSRDADCKCSTHPLTIAVNRHLTIYNPLSLLMSPPPLHISLLVSCSLFPSHPSQSSQCGPIS